MKQLVALCMLTVLLASCNNSEPDIHKADSAVKAAADTIKASVDTAVRKIDSGIRAMADTATSKIHAAGDDLKKKLKN
jgi:PBP1b-binding outer membrane lipoprotein LpoB